MSWGGARSGAGRPAGGIKETTRLLNDAIKQGLVLAGRHKGLRYEDQERVATETAAMIVSDMVLGGRGDEVLRLLAVSEGKSTGAGSQNGRQSWLTQALSSMPGMSGGSQRDQAARQGPKNGSNSEDSAPGAHDPVSDAPLKAPFFTPQPPLLGHSSDHAQGDDDSAIDEGARAESAPARTPTAPPHPPLARSHISLRVSGEDFEKNSEDPG